MSEPVDLYPLGIGLSFVRSDEAARQGVRERAEAGMDAIKISVESGPTMSGDDHPLMSVEMIPAIVNEVNRHGLRTWACFTTEELPRPRTAVPGSRDQRRAGGRPRRSDPEGG